MTYIVGKNSTLAARSLPRLMLARFVAAMLLAAATTP